MKQTQAEKRQTVEKIWDSGNDSNELSEFSF